MEISTMREKYYSMGIKIACYKLHILNYLHKEWMGKEGRKTLNE
jgi:hypothetical protein